MFEILKQSLWKHFGGSIDMLGNAISMCPEDMWLSDKKFFYTAYHCLVFLDYYLTIPPKDFSARLPYTLTDFDQLPDGAIDDVVPNKIYSKNEMLDWLNSTRKKCHDLIKGLTEEKLKKSWISGSDNINLELSGGEALGYPVLDILIYNMKHVQHHVGQLNFMLRQAINNAPDYVPTAVDDL